MLPRHPRLVAAKGLVTVGAVSSVGTLAWRVRGEHDTYDVRPTGPRLACTCPWELEHAGGRGPCKHILAVSLTLQPPDRTGPSGDVASGRPVQD